MIVNITDENVYINGKKINSSNYSFPGSRAIIRRDGYIVKFETGRDDPIEWGQCAHELERVIPSEYQKYFAPIIEGDNRYVCQKILKFRRGKRPAWAYSFVKELAAMVGMQDIHSGNWAMLENGQPIIFDYGY